MNPVVISVCVMLVLALMRVNVVVALTFSAIIGGLIGGMPLAETVSAFEGGLGGGATTALSYAMLGTFAVAISRSGITDVLAQKVIKRISGHENAAAATGVKYSVLIILVLLAISSQNIIPVHIAFIPIVIPPPAACICKVETGSSPDCLCADIRSGNTVYGSACRLWRYFSQQYLAEKPT